MEAGRAGADAQINEKLLWGKMRSAVTTTNSATIFNTAELPPATDSNISPNTG